jgi:hypothetical protein
MKMIVTLVNITLVTNENVTYVNITLVTLVNVAPQKVACLLQAVYAEQVEHQAVAGGELALQRLRACSNDAVGSFSSLIPAGVGQQ